MKPNRKKIFALLVAPLAVLLCVAAVFLVKSAVRLNFAVGSFLADRRGNLSDESLFYYNTLSWREQQLYTVLSDAVTRLDPITENVSYLYDEQSFNSVVNAYLSDHPDCFYLDRTATALETNGNVTRLNLSYIGTAEEVSSMQNELAAHVESMVQGLPTHATPYEQALFLHDAICRAVQVLSFAEEASPQAQSAYGALVGGVADSRGYAAAYQLLMQRAQLSCEIVHGTVGGTVRTWNAIRPGDAQTLFCDLTLDDVGNGQGGANYVFHGYFGLSYSHMTQDHIAAVPALWENDGEDTDYFTAVNRRLDASAETRAEQLFRLIGETLSNGETEVEFAYLPADPSEDARTTVDQAIREAVNRWNQENSTPQCKQEYSLFCTSEVVGGYTAFLLLDS